MAQAKNAKSATPTSSKKPASANVTTLHPAVAKASQATTGSVKITREQIAQRAHELWAKSGRKHGHDEQNWLEAERQLKAELAGK